MPKKEELPKPFCFESFKHRLVRGRVHYTQAEYGGTEWDHSKT